ncbi:CAP domain-containing protein [Salinimicrobium sp. GXAS 041]|uniref:CAP domain-containing protein n=1 Tax=Salinimicrobium sp. GXAS 041 TaxID=3400806 RepID=UPI003C787B57
MKKLASQLCLLALCVISLSSCSKENIDENSTSDLVAVAPPVKYTPIEVEIMERVNSYRAEKGLPQLDFIDEISWVAEDHNFHMIQKNEVCHDNFPSRYTELVNSVGAKAVSENVGYGYHSAEAVVKAWINSDGHRKNMEGELTHFGISVKEDASGKLYFTNIFVRK